jgi:hypothetical protein
MATLITLQMLTAADFERVEADAKAKLLVAVPSRTGRVLTAVWVCGVG